MNESEYLKGRIEALSLIVGAMFIETPPADSKFAAKLVSLANEFFTDRPLDTQTSEFRSGFHQEFDRMIAMLDGLRH
ncbi:MAG: hypothetical protein OXP28_08295 [Gammaproteobacteria bacterium]|nr:hypothetical protein [Gammaproteobacteria bacterium]